MSSERQICITGCEEPEEPTAAFRTVLMDIPWPEIGAGKVKRGCDRHYPVITSKAEILRTIVTAPVWSRVAQSAHLYLWSTSNYESWAHWLIDALGFKHHVSLPWVKPGNAGLGQYFRGAHEPLLFATRGQGFDAKTESRSLRTDCLVGAPRPVDGNGKRIHSAKPVRSFEIVEERSRPPFLEMFARGEPFNEKWSAWGNEAKAPTGDQHVVLA